MGTRFLSATLVRGGVGTALVCAQLAVLVTACGRIPQLPITRWEGEKPPDFSARKQCTVSTPEGCETACKAGDSEACGTIRAAKAIDGGGGGATGADAAGD